MAGLRIRSHNVFETNNGITNDETVLKTDKNITHGMNRLEIALSANVA
jgi:hypothetical protein